MKYMLGVLLVGLMVGVARAEYTVEVATGNIVMITETSVRTVNKSSEIAALTKAQVNIDLEIGQLNDQIANCNSTKSDKQSQKDALQAKIDALTNAQ